MEKRILLTISLLAILSMVTVGHVNAMRSLVFKPADSVSEIINDSAEDGTRGAKKRAAAAFVRAYKKDHVYTKKTRLFLNAVLREDLKRAKWHLTHSKFCEFLRMLRVLAFFQINEKTVRFLVPIIEKRVAAKNFDWFKKHSNLLRTVETAHFKSLAHQKLAKILESTKKKREILTLNKKLTTIFQGLPEGLKNHFISTGCVVNYGTSPFTKKTLLLKKWLAKKGVAQKIIDLLNVNTPLFEEDFNVYSKVDMEALYNGDIPNLSFDTLTNFYKERFFTTAIATCGTLALGIGLKHCLMPGLPFCTDIILGAGVIYSALFTGLALGLQPNPLHKKFLDWAHEWKEELDPYK